MKNLLSLRTLCSLLLSVAATGLQAQPSAVQSFPLSADYEGAFIQLLSSDNGKPTRWVVASPKQGIMIVAADRKVQGRLDVMAGLLDLRSGLSVSGKPVTVIATVIEAEQTPALLSVDAAGGLQELVRLPAAEFQIENLCLQRDNDNNVYMYLLDERGTAGHWLVLDNKGRPQAQHVRNLPIAPNSKACSVDDAQSVLYVSEEEVGVWSYDASPEAAPGRKPVDLTTPFGKLAGGAEALTSIPGGVAAIAIEGAALQVYKTSGKGVQLKTSIDLSSLEEPERVSRSRFANGTLEFLVYDDASGGHYQVSMPWDGPQKVKSPKISEVYAEYQTEPVARFGDAADDPAIWVHPKKPQSSRVLGTDKQNGLNVYDMQGRKLQFIPSGHVNNVDVRYGLRLGKKTVDLAIASDRDDNSLALYTINPKNGEVSAAGNIPTTMEDIYGFCMYQPTANEIYAIANNESGEFQQYLITVDESGKIGGRLVRSFRVASQPEGCVADDANRQLYVGEESTAVWVIGADPSSGTKLKPVIRGGGILVPDIEGVGLYKGQKRNYLVISSQGNNSYVVVEAQAPYRVRGAFRVGVNGAAKIDATSETDGLEVTSRNLGGVFSEGMLVVQDGHKVMPEAPQNFKYIPWSSIRTALALE
ncbi:MAG TPA: phytase [Gammaproteobacteria bacterium]